MRVPIGIIGSVLGAALAFFLLTGFTVGMAADTPQAESGVVLQILGSGGPFGGDKRASTGYLVWVNDHARVQIDAGGGTFLRLKQAGARFQDVLLVGLTHFHPDHTSDLPAVLWSGIGRRDVPLVISGPAEKGKLPGLNTFLSSLFDRERGAFPWLGSKLDKSVKAVTVALQNDLPVEVYRDADMKVSAIAVPHSNLPAVGYRVDVGSVSIGFGGDQTGTNPAFTKLVQGVDVLVMHFGVSEEVTGGPSRFHAKPSVVGKVAQAAGVKTLVLSHLMKRADSKNFSLHNLESNLTHVKANYSGPVVLAEDLQRIEVK